MIGRTNAGWAALLLLIVALAAAAPAAASPLTLNGALSGSLTIEFHGDAAAGCAAHGVCPYSGTIVWSSAPDSSGGGFEFSTADSDVVFIDASGNSKLTATVQRSGPDGSIGTCADAAQSPVFPTATRRDGRLTVTLLESASGTLANRCAGPRDADLARTIPRETIAVSSVLHRSRKLNFSGRWPLRSGGFAGTVTSTLVLRVGPAPSQDGGGGGGGPMIVQRRVTMPLRLVAAAGGLTERYTGAGTDLGCDLLDSCGAAGTFSTDMTSSAARGEVTAVGPPHRPLLDYLTALRAARGGRTRGITVSGGLFWTARGEQQVTLVQDGNRCRDNGPLRFADLGIGGDTVNLLTDGAPDTFRCPAPAETTFGAPLGAALRLGPTTFAPRRVHLRLPASAPPQDSGYRITTGGAVELTLERGRITSRLQREPRF